MTEFKEVYAKTQRKAALLDLMDELNAERKQLDAEVRKLQIIAHNEQADVDNLDSPGIKSILLGLTGKKQERLEKEQSEARNALQNYELTKLKLESVIQKIDIYAAELASLGLCDESLRRLLSLPEDPTLAILVQCTSDLSRIRDDISPLIRKLSQVSQLGAFRNGTSSTSALSGTDDKLLAMERTAQDMLIEIKTSLRVLQENLAPFGILINTAELDGIKDDYLTDVYTSALITSRVEKVTVMLRQIGFQLDAINPNLAALVSKKQKEQLRLLLDAAVNTSKYQQALN